MLYPSLVILASIYAPNLDDAHLFKDFLSRLPDINTYYLILGGDFNCVLPTILDRSSLKSAPLSKCSTIINTFLNSYGVSDVWRFLNPTARDYSFFSHVHKTFSRIDYFLLDNKLLSSVRSCSYQTIVISDHAPLSLELTLPNQPL